MGPGAHADSQPITSFHLDDEYGILILVIFFCHINPDAGGG